MSGSAEPHAVDLSDGLPDPSGVISMEPLERARRSAMNRVIAKVRSGDVEAVTTLFAHFKTDEIRRDAAHKLLKPAVYSQNFDMVRVLEPYIDEGNAHYALTYALWPDKDIGPMSISQREIARLVSPKIPQKIKDNILDHHVYWALNYADMEEDENAHAHFHRIVYLVAIGGSLEFRSSMRDQASIQEHARILEQQGKPDLNNAIARGLSVKSLWSEKPDHMETNDHAEIAAIVPRGRVLPFRGRDLKS